MTAIELLERQQDMIQSYRDSLNAVIGQRDEMMRALANYRRVIAKGAEKSDASTASLLQAIDSHLYSIQNTPYR